MHHMVNTATAPPITSPMSIPVSMLNVLSMSPIIKIIAINFVLPIPISSILSIKLLIPVITVMITVTVNEVTNLDVKYLTVLVPVRLILVRTPFF